MKETIFIIYKKYKYENINFIEKYFKQKEKLYDLNYYKS